MAGYNWMDDRERQTRERDTRGVSDYRRDSYRDPAFRASYDEDRSWDQDDGPISDPSSRQRGQRVFGERESGVSYGGPSAGARGGYRSAGYSRGWSDTRYGATPRREGYGRVPRFSREDYRDESQYGGGRFYGDDGAGHIYREEYGQGGVDYGDTPRGYDAGYSPTRERYHAQGYGQPGYGGYEGSRRDFDRPASGGTGGYDYERGYGDGGRGQYGDRYASQAYGRPYGDADRSRSFEHAGHRAGEALRHAGEKVASWFNAGGEGALYDDDASRVTHRGRGPSGYKRADDRIMDDAHDRLTDDAWLDASNITVSVSGGEVTLSGTVENRESKHRAERLVEDVSGVNHVQNNLRVAKGNFFTSASPGYGDSVLGAQLREADQENAVSNGAASATGKKN